MPLLPLLGANNCLPLLNMSKRFICLEETGECINEFEIGYMINQSLHIKKSFRDQAEKSMNTTFGALTQYLLKPHYKKNTSVLALLMFNDTRGVKPRNCFIVLSCII